VLNLDQELLDGIRQIIREEISGVEGDVSSLKSDVSSLKSDVSSLKSDVSSLKSDVSSLKSDVSSLKSDVSSLKSDVSSLKSDVSTLKKDVSEMKSQLEENTDMVRVLLSNSKTHGAKIEQLDHRVAGLEGNKKRQDKLEIGLLNHQHEVVVEIGKSVFDN
jgi:chromosome segregation ATPase